MSPSAASDGVACMLMRGGTSKGAYFRVEDLPAEPAARDDLILRIMGSPHPQQIDGLGGAHPLTSKVAIVGLSQEPGVDLDYEFLQVGVDEPTVSGAQTCGNLLAGVAPFAIERDMLAAGDPETVVRIRLRNTGDLAVARLATPGGILSYDGDAEIDGVPGTGNPISLEVTTGAGPLLPTGLVAEEILGRRASLVSNGMPVVVLDAAEFGVAGDETPAELESRDGLRRAVEEVRIEAGRRMGLGDVSGLSVPKMMLVSPPRHGGAVSVRAFIPHRVHTALGVLMGAGVAAAVQLPGAVGSEMAAPVEDGEVLLEHPKGVLRSRVRVERSGGSWRASSTSLRTARKIFDGSVFPGPALPRRAAGAAGGAGAAGAAEGAR